MEIKTTLTLSKQAKAQLQKYEKYSNLSFLVNLTLYSDSCVYLFTNLTYIGSTKGKTTIEILFV